MTLFSSSVVRGDLILVIMVLSRLRTSLMPSSPEQTVHRSICKEESFNKILTVDTILDSQPVPNTPPNCFRKATGVRNEMAKELPGSMVGDQEMEASDGKEDEDDTGEGVESAKEYNLVGEDGDGLRSDRASMFNIIPSTVEPAKHRMAIRILRFTSLVW